jgi:hypothetical protein
MIWTILSVHRTQSRPDPLVSGIRASYVGSVGENSENVMPLVVFDPATRNYDEKLDLLTVTAALDGTTKVSCRAGADVRIPLHDRCQESGYRIDTPVDLLPFLEMYFERRILESRFDDTAQSVVTLSEDDLTSS